MPTGIGAGIAGRVFGNKCGGANPPVTPSWDCGAAGCFDPGTGLGQYSSFAACKTGCQPKVCEDLYSCRFTQGTVNTWLNNNTTPLSVGLNGLGNFTIAFWVKFDTSSTGSEQGVFSWGGGNDPKIQLYLLANGSGLQFNMTNINAGGSTWNDGTGIINPPINTWIHYAYTADRDKEELNMTGEWFENGISKGAKTAAFPRNINDMNFPVGDNYYFGRRGSSISTQSLQGNLDDFTIWDQVLTSAEILELMDVSLKNTDCMDDLTFYSKITHWWEMGDNHVPPGPSTFPTIVDSIGSIDLTMVNMSGTNIVLDTP